MFESKIYAYDCDECGVVFDAETKNGNFSCINCHSLITPITYKMAQKIQLMEKARKLRMRSVHVFLLETGVLTFIMTSNKIHNLTKILSILLIILIILNIYNIHRLTKTINRVKQNV